MPIDRAAFQKLVSVHASPKTRVTCVTSVTAREIKDLARHTSASECVTRVTPSAGEDIAHAACDQIASNCVTNKSKQEQVLSSIGHTVTRSHAIIDREKISEGISFAVSTNAEEWLAYFGERAGIREFDGGLSRDEAERLALADTVAVLGPPPSLH